MIVVGPDAVLAERPDDAWLRGSPSLQPVARDPRGVAYRVRGPLRLACPPA
jgi:hypothetical protein